MWTTPAPGRAPAALRSRLAGDPGRAAAPVGAASDRSAPGSRRPTLDDVVVAAPAALIALVLALRWSGGWLLLLDWAPGPRWEPWTGPRLPVGAALRSVVGAVAAVDPALLGWLLPTGGVLVAYAGGVRLAAGWRGPDGAPPAPVALAVAGCVAAANPFVAARAFAGQIGVLWGYALAWWLVSSLVGSVERRGLRAAVVPGLWLAATAACTVHMALIGLIPVVAAGGLLHRRHDVRTAVSRTLTTVGVGAALTAAWLVPSIAAGSHGVGDPGGRAAAQAFASGGPLTTLWARAAGGAGFWRALPPGALVASGLVVAAAWVATVVAWRRGAGHSRDLRHLLLGCAVVAVAAAHVGRGPTADAWSWLVENFWPAGLLREPGKLTMLAVMAPACGAAAFVDGLLERSTAERPHRRPVAYAVLVAAVAATAAVWLSISGLTSPSAYPTEWATARSLAGADDCPIAVAGDGAYTNPGFTGGRVVAHPARHYFGPRAIVSDDPGIDGIRPRRPDTAAQRWTQQVNDRWMWDQGRRPRSGDATAAGVGWVLVDRPVDRPHIVKELGRGGFEPALLVDRVGLWRAAGGCS